MSGSGPVGGEVAGRDAAAGAAGAGGRARALWWLLALAAVVVVLVWRPWVDRHEPSASSTPMRAATVAPTATPTPTPTPIPTPVPSPSPPGSSAAFSVATAQGLFVTEQQLVDTIPDAAAGVSATIGRGQLNWGLPVGASVVPASCTVARTVVATLPVGGYDARGYTTGTLAWVQEVTLLAGPEAARAAFAELVTAVDRCPQYAQVTATGSTVTWTAQPAIEGQGLYPSIVQPFATTAAAGTAVGYRGHLLVGNAIVTWTVQTTSPRGPGGLGPADALAGIVQDRALAAVRALH